MIALFTTYSVKAQQTVATTTLNNCQTQIVTIVSRTSVTYNLNTNQIVTLTGFYFPNQNSGSIICTLYDGVSLTNFMGGPPFNYSQDYLNTFRFTGLSNITLHPSTNNNSSSSFLTFTVVTPSTNSVTYTPANSVVIPTDATGNVQIILQSSSDLVNWIPSLPGTYGSTYTNRFFRVIAVVQ
jgi:hypothetical protein